MIKYSDVRNQIIESMKKVDQQYYTPLVAKSENASDTVKRERNYCYELYHQMRSNSKLTNLIKDEYTFSSEMDKKGHKLIKENLIPDFILHRPGKMSLENKDNYLVIEVKAVLDNKSYEGIAKDIESLALMLSEYKYQHGMFILINHNLDELKHKFNFISNKKNYKKLTKEQKDKFSKIDIVCSKKMGLIDEVITLEELINEVGRNE